MSSLPKTDTKIQSSANTNPNHAQPVLTSKLGAAQSMTRGPSKEIPSARYHPAARAEAQVRGQTGQGKPLTDFKSDPVTLM